MSVEAAPAPATADAQVLTDDALAFVAERTELEGTPHLDEAVSLLEQVALADELPEFLTLPAYELLTEGDS